MCRIAGIVSTNKPTESNLPYVEKMCLSMKHGGPDGHGLFSSDDERVTLGNRRLSLIDLSDEADQPMQVKDITITYNGEVYNHIEIRDELIELGYEFKTESDTEVILTAYKAWGTSSFVKLKGMMAFAISDESINKVYLVRGPLGIKPLYYSFIDGDLTFASEVKAFNHAKYQYKEKTNWQVYFLAFGHIPEPYTTLENVTSLPKAHFLEMDLLSGKIQVKRYHTFRYEETVTDKTKAEKLIHNSLRMAVKKHLICDAPIGLFLSGGIDSSILALLADESTKYLKTISVNFSEQSFSEKKYQLIIAEKILSKHAGYTLDFHEFKQNFDKALMAMDQPTNDGINTWFISKYAKENGLKAVLSGIGADELFGGYASFQRTGIVSILKALPPFALKIISLLPFNSTKRCYFLSYKNLVGEYLFLRGLYTPELISGLLNMKKQEVNRLLSSLMLEIPEAIFSKEKARISWLESNLYLQNQLLKDTDYMSMSHGVEVRTPFLDVDFVQACLKIKSALRFDNRQKKRMLVDSFTGILPKEIWARPKMGFTFPFAAWLRKIDKINNKTIYKGNAYAMKLFRKFKNGHLSWAKMLVLYQVSAANYDALHDPAKISGK
ncbi:MAG: asparagine synthase (glutamine-hydrolyzing) [Sphingobacteriales bacterium]|nr:MAG: asparagine synthase (glutamine-hydrolyzing) [Sphingobacteriales bacterium]